VQHDEEQEVDKRLTAGVRVRFLPRIHKATYDAGLEGQEGIIVGERWGKTIRVQMQDGRVWLTFPHRVEVIE
jgi:hypothetical protein